MAPFAAAWLRARTRPPDHPSTDPAATSGTSRNSSPTCATVEEATNRFSPVASSAPNDPHRIANAPIAPMSWAAEVVTRSGTARNHSRISTAKATLTITADSNGLTALGASVCAAGSQKCKGTSGALSSSPIVMTASPSRASGAASSATANSENTTVPDCDQTRAIPSSIVVEATSSA